MASGAEPRQAEANPAAWVPVLVPGGGFQRPTCPRVVLLPDSEATPPLTMPLVRLRIEVYVHMSVAFVKVRGEWRNGTARPANCVFELPVNSKATVTSVDVLLGDGKAFASTVVDSKATEGKKGAAAEPGGESPLSAAMQSYFAAAGGSYRSGSYDPDVFRVPFTDVPPGSTVSVHGMYFQDLRFVAGSYGIRVPLTIEDGTLDAGGPLAERVSVHCEINTGTPDSDWGGTSHDMRVLESVPSRVVLESNTAGAQPNDDFTISYKAWSRSVLTNLQVQPNPGNDGGSFILFMAPPQADVIADAAREASFGRRIVFLIDNSGSMTGMPMAQAKQALISALDELRPHDMFAICVFNHEQDWWIPGGAAFDPYAERGHDRGMRGNPYDGIGVREGTVAPPGVTMSAATPDMVAAAKAYASTISTTGMTNILAPVTQSIELLRATAKIDPAASSAVPLLFLLTDGAVPNERDVCTYIKEALTTLPARVFTFGIGQYCNAYFLKMMAQLGRGYNDINLRGEGLKEDIVALMAKASLPVLLDVTLAMDVASAELYPFPIPDLFCGAPVVVAGRYSGVFPRQIQLMGRLPSPAAGHAITGEGSGAAVINDKARGPMLAQNVMTLLASHVPVDKVFVKQRLDLLIANDWLTNGADPELRATVVNASVEGSMPCPYTAMVLYPTTAAEVEDGRKAEEEGGGGGGAAPPRKKGSGMSTTGKVLVGGAIVLGASVAAVAAFGSVAGSAGDVSGLVDGLGGMDFSGFGGGGFDIPPCCSCFGEAECGQCCSAHEGALDLCFGNCGDGCRECGAAFGTCTGEITAGFSSCCAQCGQGLTCSGSIPEGASCPCGDNAVCASLYSMVAGVGDLAGSMFQGICGGLGSCCTTCGDCTSGCFSSYSDFLQNIDCASICGSCSACGSGFGSAIGGCLNGCSGTVGGLIGGVGDCAGGCVGQVGEVCGGVGSTCMDVLGQCDLGSIDCSGC